MKLKILRRWGLCWLGRKMACWFAERLAQIAVSPMPGFATASGIGFPSGASLEAGRPEAALMHEAGGKRSMSNVRSAHSSFIDDVFAPLALPHDGDMPSVPLVEPADNFPRSLIQDALDRVSLLSLVERSGRITVLEHDFAALNTHIFAPRGNAMCGNATRSIHRQIVNFWLMD